MAKQVINIGQNANDSTGDALRTAFEKCNNNFSDLYSDDAGDVGSFTNANGTYVSAATVNTAATGAVTTGVIDLSAVDGTSDLTTRFLSKDNTWDVIDRITGSGTVNKIPLFSGSKVLANSVIAQSGTNIGIGTNNPGSDLHIYDSFPRITLQDSDGTNTQGFLDFSGGQLGFNTQNGTSNGEILFQRYNGTTTSESMRITSSGNVGIGTTTASEKLEVAGNVILDADNANIKIKSGVTGTKGDIQWTFNTDSPVPPFASVGIEYDNRTTDGFLIDSGYPITLDTSTYTRFSRNGSEHMRITPTGNVGIGTTTPVQHLSSTETVLHISNSNVASLNLDSTGGDCYVLSSISNGDFRIYNDDTNTSPFVINSAGNVGIGTTTPSNARLDVQTSSNQAIYAITDGGWNGLEFTSDNGTTIGALNAYLGNIYVGTTNGNGGVTGALTINSSGNVGIGTTTPGSYKLNVAGTGYFSNQLTVDGFTNDAGISFREGFTPANVGIRAKAVASSNRDGLELLGHNGIDFSVNNGANVAMRIVGVAGSGIGNIGIGTTAPSAPLSFGKAVYGAPSSEDFFRIKFQDLGGIYNDVGIGQTASGSLGFNTEVAGVTSFNRGTAGEQMRIDSTGNVGIGTTAPADKLSISSSINQIGLDSGDIATYGTLDLGMFTNGAFIGTQAGSNTQSDLLRFGTAGAERMRITSTGNVGIGATASSAKLEVAGNVIIDDAVGRITLDSINGANRVMSTTTGFSAYEDLQFRADNYIFGTGATERMRITSTGSISLSQGTGNSYVGTGAGNLGTSTGTYNSAFGVNSLYSNTTGSNNTANGYESLRANTTGVENTANGYQALFSNTTADYNTAIGFAALYFNTTGSNNTANGYRALFSNTTGSLNTANGRLALYSNTTGLGNNAFGINSLYSNTTGDFNIANGYQALFSSTTAVNNTANGVNSLYSNTTGSQNTASGRDALYSNTTGNNNAGIGYNAQATSATANNEITLGNSSITVLRCNTQTISSLSDIRDKKNIKKLRGAEAFIKELKPVSFVWNQRDGGRVDINDNGFIAQDLIEAQEKSGHKIPNLVLKNNPEKLEAAYGAMLPTIVFALQSALKQIDLLKTEIETLKNR